jgi:hypothetical protein
MGRIRALCFSLWLRAERPLRAQRQVGDGFRWGKRAYGMAWPQFALAAVKDDDLLAEGHDEPVCFALDAGNLTRARRRSAEMRNANTVEYGVPNTSWHG